jgi:hypothetical protein
MVDFKKFISDNIDLSLVDTRKFNIIASGTGTGKTWFVANELTKHMLNIKPYEVLFVTSRSLIVDQQEKVEGINKYNMHNITFIKHWNGEEDYYGYLEKKGIQIMTYDKIIGILQTQNAEGFETLSRVKIIIFDECHTLFSDRFIKDLEMLKVWIRDTLYIGNKTIIGMTATPNIVAYYQKEWGVSVNQLNKEVLVNYKAKQLHCTNFDTIPYIITTKLEGKTIIMCYSVSDCRKLKEDLPNAFILISKSNKEFTDEMNKVRQYIVDCESLPDTFVDDDGIEKELDILITTSTLREGVNLREVSGVRNVICCFTDELHITQFAGRCRYNIDNLIVANTYVNADNYDKNNYLTKCRNSYKEFIKNSDNTSWFDSIAHLVQHDIYDVKRFILNSNEKEFIDYINKNWLVPKGINTKVELDKYKIYKAEDKEEIIKMVIKCKLLKLYYSQLTFNKVITLMQDNLGYKIESSRIKIKQKQYTYKLIIDFDEDKIDFEDEDVMEE